MPDAPLALAGGETVSLAWSLPPAPKVDMVVIYRSGKEAAGLSEVARVNGSDLQWTDKDVALGRTYEYRIQTLKGAKNSGISGHVEVTVGDSARITFIGGSVDRALFEVMMFRRGRRVSSRFIHKPGDPIGDLSYVPDLDTIEDFRLGPRLLKLDIGVAETRETSSETLGDASGQTMKDLGGREVRIDFTYPGATNEVMIATILDAQDRPVKLKEGESYKTD
ncbi:MAG: fibronectin type III domain-containing protein [Planctomycetes bacterium]|nr:fibronectin type III domain-containing protein [Planctomycetota bacterium]